LLGNGSANTTVVRQGLGTCHVTSATLTHVTIEDLLEAVFSVWSAMAAAARKGVS
jgi:hypothetical protein